ncbi:MAG: hypothetical protein AB7D26_10340, partial [Marinobacterium sp.]
LSNSDLSRRFVHRTSDRSRSEVLCTHGGQPSELVQSPSENDISAVLETRQSRRLDSRAVFENGTDKASTGAARILTVAS